MNNATKDIKKLVTTNVKELVIVTGLPRSGTSLMMQILQKVGVPLLYDNSKVPDEHNPYGYYECERVKNIPKSNDWEWLKNYAGYAVKIISPILVNIPIEFPCKMILMVRNLEEVIASQEKVSGREKTSYERKHFVVLYGKHISSIRNKFQSSSYVKMMEVNYNELISSPHLILERLSNFLEIPIDVPNIAKVVDSNLYRTKGG